MSTQYRCDWCGAVFDEREQVGHVDITIGTFAESLHMCGRCAPDFLTDHYPERMPLREGDV